MSEHGAIEPTWAQDVIDFWFRQLGEANWFARSAAVDDAIRERFLGLHQRLAAGHAVERTSAREMLAAVIVLDQFSRNMFRGTPPAFASDSIALGLARDAVDRGLDRAMTREQRLFLYLPFEHSEDRADQALAVGLISQLGNEEWTRYAEAHRSVIDRFGRFPHRNAILGRDSTEDERALLEKPLGWF